MVKFGRRMAFELVPEWQEFYVNYSTLKRIVYSNAEPMPTGAQEIGEYERTVLKAVSAELTRADAHYSKTLDKLREACDGLRLGRHATDGSAPTTGYSSVDLTAAADPDEATNRAEMYEWFSTAQQLSRFAELNTLAPIKAARKGEKTVPGARLKHLVEEETQHTAMVNRAHDLTVMVEAVKRDFVAKFGVSIEQFHDVEVVPKRWAPNYRALVLSIVAFFMTLMFPILDGHAEAKACLALLVLVVCLWITEAIPYFATALLIPLVAVPFNVIRDADTKQTAASPDAAHVLLAKMFEPVQIMVIGGLTMAKALDKAEIAPIWAKWLHNGTASRPGLYMLGIMAVGCAICGVVSNVAAPVLVLSVVQRSLQRMPRPADGRPVAQKAILLGLAIACNLGGMITPIASPQNAVALHTVTHEDHVGKARVVMEVSFLRWLLFAGPIAAVLLIVAWVLLLKLLKPFDHFTHIPLPELKLDDDNDVTNRTRTIVVIVCGVTVFLWCLGVDGVFGGPAAAALVPIVFFFGCGLLEKNDFNTLPWHLIFLLAGGSMLGLCAQSSGLLHIVSTTLIAQLKGMSGAALVALVVLSVGVITSFVSHTVGAMVLLPLIATLVPMHAAAGGVSAITLVMVSVVMCSGAMAFPMTSFPNMNSLVAEDEQGVPYLEPRDFLVPGGVVSALCAGILMVCGPWWAGIVLGGL